MKFKGEGRPLTTDGLTAARDELGITDADVWTLLAVETRGFGYLRDRRPQILFERHWFSRLTDRQYDSTDSDISNRVSGGYRGGAAEYQRLKNAMELDMDAAIKSTSWGIGQVMGFNYRRAGYASVDDLVAGMVKDEDTQLLAVIEFIDSRGLSAALRTHRWAEFARGYNGSGYRKNEYDTRLEATHAKFDVALPDLALRLAQVALVYLGYDPGPVDGMWGRRTRSAIALFEEDAGLEVTGRLNKWTRYALVEEAFDEST